MSISNTEIASRISALVDRWNTRENQMVAMLSQPEGTVTVTDGLGQNHTLPSFPQLQLDVAAMVDDLTGTASEAAVYANEALQHRNAAAASAAASSAAASGVEAHRTAAEAAATSASASASTATGRATAAAGSATAAAGSATAASGSATTAGTHASTASGHAGAASSHASTASGARVAAETARDKANLFANAPQGTEVEPGAYSAKHWATQAQAAVTGTVVYMGTWSAASGAFPASPARGHFYRVTGTGTVGGIQFTAGDQLLYGESAWEKIDNTDAVTTVAGKSGAVALVAGDIGGLGALATRGTADWNTHVSGKPTSFPPSTHGHAIADVSGLQGALDGKAASSHTHTIANVTGLQGALDAKQASLGYAPVRQGTGTGQQPGSIIHIGWNDADGLTAQVGNTPAGTFAFTWWVDSNYAPVGHGHAISSVSGLQTALNGKLPVTGGALTGALSIPQLSTGPQLAVGTYSTMSADGGGRVMFANNATLWASGAFAYLNEHPSLGASGILLPAFGAPGPHFFETGSVATSAGGGFSPTLRMMLHEGNSSRVIVSATDPGNVPEGTLWAW